MKNSSKKPKSGISTKNQRGGINASGKARVKVGRDQAGRDIIKRDEYNAQNIYINSDAAPEISDADYEAAQKSYLGQVIKRTEVLEFVGIPEHGKRQQDVKLEDIFVPLGAEEEVPTKEVEVIAGREKTERGDEFERLQARVSEGRVTTRRVSLDEALSSHKRMMIVGDPGAGKSTLLRYLTLMAARGMGEGATRVDGAGEHKASPLHEMRMPILIPLRRYAASGEKTLADYFYVYAKEAYQLELQKGFFERALNEGDCLVCLDGLDEVVLAEQRVMVRDAVAALASRYPGNRLVVTSRIVGYEQAPLERRTFAHHKVLPFGKEEIEQFVRKWYDARERVPAEAKQQADGLVKTIHGNDRLLKLAENPLMLTIIALVHRIEAELPNERVKLYDKCTEVLLGTWEGVKGFAQWDWRISRRNEINQIGRIVWMRMAEELTFVPDMDKEFHGAP